MADEKKGLPTLAWVGIGCGCLLLLGGAIGIGSCWWVGNKVQEMAAEFEDNPAVFATVLAIKASPDHELIEADKEAETVTFRVISTGEEATVSFADIEEGRFSLTTDEGESSIDWSESEEGEGGEVTFTSPEGTATFGTGASATDLPDWVPVYPGAEVRGGTHSQTAQGRQGAAVLAVSGDFETVLDWYQDAFEERGHETQRSVTTGTDGGYGTVASTGAVNGRTLNVVVVVQGDELNVTVHYADENG